MGVFWFKLAIFVHFFVQEIGRRDIAKCPSPKYATGSTLTEAGSLLTELSHDDVLKSPRSC